jgi:hypothetical protein
MFEPSIDQPGAMDDLDLVYAMTREGQTPHLYRGEIPPGGFIHRLAICGRFTVDRVAVPSETARGQICLWCEKTLAAEQDPEIGKAKEVSRRRRNRLRAKAQGRALTKLVQLYRDRYAELYRQYRAVGRTASAAQSHARMRMSREYPVVFRRLYDQEWRSVRGIPAQDPPVTTRQGR